MANKFKLPIRASVDDAQLRALITRIQELDKKAGRGAIRKGLGELTKAILWSARGYLKKRGPLYRSLGRKVVVQRGGAKLLGIVKPRGGSKFAVDVNGKKINPARYAHLVEFGRVAVVIKSKKVLSAGKGKTFGTKARAVPERPFMRPAWADNQDSAVPTLHKWLAEATRKYWDKERAKVPKAKRIT